MAPQVRELLENFHVAELWTDLANPKSLENNELLNNKYGAALPLYVLFTPDGDEIVRIGGRPSLGPFVEFLKKGL